MSTIQTPRAPSTSNKTATTKASHDRERVKILLPELTNGPEVTIWQASRLAVTMTVREGYEPATPGPAPLYYI